MIQTENITVSVKGKDLLSGVSVSFDASKMNLIIGPNGAGKSTFIKVVSGQIQPQSGYVIMDREKLSDLSNAHLSKKRAVLSQNIDLAFPLKVWEVVMMGRYPHFTEKPGRRDEEAVEAAMRFFEVWDMGDRNYITLSGGEKQRVHFARVASQLWYSVPGAHRYLILDEPLTFLDVYFQFQFMHKIKELLKDKDWVVLGVVHDLQLAARFGDQITLLHNGKVLAHGPKEIVLTEDNIRKAYNMNAVIERYQGNMRLFF
jgi:iron complex transport system ATP-binding protein